MRLKHLRLVSDRSVVGSDDRAPRALVVAVLKKRFGNVETDFLRKSVDPVMVTIRDNAVLAPVADGTHRTTAITGDAGGAAEPVDHLIDRDGFIDAVLSGHEEHYSAILNNVNMENPEFRSMAGAVIIAPMTEMPNIPPRALVGMRLKAGRRATGKSQADVARLLEITPNKWNQWETGKHMPDALILIEFSNTYNISLDWIYRGRTDGMPAELSERVWAIFNGLVAEVSSAA